MHLLLEAKQLQNICATFFVKEEELDSQMIEIKLIHMHEEIRNYPQ